MNAISPNRDKPRVRVPANGKAFTTDSFVNFAANVGYGTQNLTAGSSYQLSPISRNHFQLEMMYRGSWLVRNIVDAVADDMTRAGIQLETDMPPDDEAALMEHFNALQLWEDLRSSIKWGRLYGGALGALMVDGQRPDEPLRIERVTQGQFKGIMVLDRWMTNPDLQDTVQVLGPDFGLPRYYNLVSDAHSVPAMRLHYSRCIRFEGADLPYWQKMAENMWGLSVIEPMWDRMIAFDSATNGAAQLVYKAHLRTLSVERLRDIISAGGPAYQAFLEQIGLIRLLQSNEGMTILDASDKFETHQYSFAGLSDVLVQFGQQLAGAAGIPLVRLFGQSPAGMNATGDSDIRNYYDMIAAQQESKLRRPLKILFEILHRSKFGRPLPEGFNFKFRPLWQMQESEKATTAQNITNTVLAVHEASLISDRTVLKELREQSTMTGVFGNITDEDIAAASADPPPPPMEGQPGMEGGEPPVPGLPGNAPSSLPGQPGRGTGVTAEEAGGSGTEVAQRGAQGGPAAEAEDDAPKPVPDLVARAQARKGRYRHGGHPDLVDKVRAGTGRRERREDAVRRVLNHPPKARLDVDGTFARLLGRRTHDERSLIDVHGMTIIVEAPKGTSRGWSGSTAAHYGYISGTGSAEGSAEQMDCFVGPDPTTPNAHIIYQNNKHGEFDEHKVMLGFANADDARQAYINSYPAGQENRIGRVETMSIPQLKRWLRVWEYALPNRADRQRAVNGI